MGIRGVQPKRVMKQKVSRVINGHRIISSRNYTQRYQEDTVTAHTYEDNHNRMSRVTWIMHLHTWGGHTDQSEQLLHRNTRE